MTLNITTNNAPRDLLCLWDFTETEQRRIRSDFDWMDSGDLEGSCGFFRYRSSVYHLSDFLRVDGAAELQGWDGYSSDSYFSGVLIRLQDDGDSVVVGRYCS